MVGGTIDGASSERPRTHSVRLMRGVKERNGSGSRARGDVHPSAPGLVIFAELERKHER